MQIINLVLILILISVVIYQGYQISRHDRELFKTEVEYFEVKQVSNFKKLREEIKDIRVMTLREHTDAEKLRHKIDILERYVDDKVVELFYRLNNPPEYKKGDKVKGLIITEVEYKKREGDLFVYLPEGYVYKAVDKKGNTVKI